MDRSASTAAPPRPAIKLLRPDHPRQLAAAATALQDRHGFDMLAHWHRVGWVARDGDPDQLDFEAMRLLCGSVWTLLDLLADPDQGDETFLVVVDGTLAGLRFVEHTHHPQVMTTGGWLAADHRGRGIGRRVLTIVTDYLHRRGALYVATCTRHDNPAARANLASCGYVRAAHLDEHGTDTGATAVPLATYVHAADGVDAAGCPPPWA